VSRLQLSSTEINISETCVIDYADLDLFSHFYVCPAESFVVYIVY